MTKGAMQLSLPLKMYEKLGQEKDLLSSKTTKCIACLLSSLPTVFGLATVMRVKSWWIHQWDCYQMIIQDITRTSTSNRRSYNHLPKWSSSWVKANSHSVTTSTTTTATTSIFVDTSNKFYGNKWTVLHRHLRQWLLLQHDLRSILTLTVSTMWMDLNFV